MCLQGEIKNEELGERKKKKRELRAEMQSTKPKETNFQEIQLC